MEGGCCQLVLLPEEQAEMLLPRSFQSPPELAPLLYHTPY